VEKLSRDEIEGRLSELEGWSLERNYIVKEFQTRN